jgi:hypothetical protein
MHGALKFTQPVFDVEFGSTLSACSMQFTSADNMFSSRIHTQVAGDAAFIGPQYAVFKARNPNSWHLQKVIVKMFFFGSDAWTAECVNFVWSTSSGDQSRQLRKRFIRGW